MGPGIIGSPSPAVSPGGVRPPAPYLFGGLAAMMSLIAISLIVLACSRRKFSSSSGDSSPSRGSEKPELAPLDMEPKVVVVMAGDAVPTYLAKAAPSLQLL